MRKASPRKVRGLHGYSALDDSFDWTRQRLMAIRRNELNWLRDFMADADANALGQVAYWDAGPPSYRWMQIAMQELTRRNVGPTLSTRAMALVGAAMHDATVATWDSKYTFNRKRPSEQDPAIIPRVSMPSSPSYPSEHAATAAAASRVLGFLFPDKAQIFESLAEEAARSRLYAGVQYPGDMTAGLTAGRLRWRRGCGVRETGRVGYGSLQRPFQLLPAFGAIQIPLRLSPDNGIHGFWLPQVSFDLRLRLRQVHRKRWRR